MSRFRINLVPQKTEVKIQKRGEFRFFKLYLEREHLEDDFFNFLRNAVESIPGVKKDTTQRPTKTDKDYYYILTTKHGIIRFEINYGGKYVIDESNPPTISIETDPYIPPADFLAEIKPVIKLLVEKTGFKIYFWNVTRFVGVEELH